MKKKRIIMLLLTVVLLIPIAVSCARADDTQTSDLGLGLSTYQEYDGWIYYSDLSSGQLYKMKPDGDERTEISGVQTFNFVINEDRIYYTAENERALYSSNTDGSDKTFICEKRFRMWPTHKMYVVDDWIYCIPKYNVLCKMKTDGTQLTWLTQPINPITDFCISGEWVYYIVQDYGESRYHLYRMHTDGTQKTQLTQDTCGSRGMDFDENWIYYVDSEGGIYKQDFYISEPIKLVDCDRCSFLKVIGDCVYYNDDLAFYKVKTDGSERTKITNVVPDSRFVDVWDNWLIYIDRSKDRAIAHMIRVGNSHKTDALIDKILADSTPDLEIRKYENTESCTPSDEIKPTSSPVKDTKPIRTPAKETRRKTTPTDAPKSNGGTFSLSSYQKHDGWIYYVDYLTGKLWRVSTDKEETMQVGDDPTGAFTIYKERITYVTYPSDNEWALCSIGMDGSDKAEPSEPQFIRSCIKELNIVDGWTYALDLYNRLVILSMDDGEIITLYDVIDYRIDGDWIYFWKQERDIERFDTSVQLWRVRRDGTQEQQLTQDFSRAIDYAGDWIYYIDTDDGDIYAASIDGTEEHKIVECDGGSFIRAIGNWLYYENWGKNQGIYRVKKDGSECQKVTDKCSQHMRFDTIWDNWLLYIGLEFEEPFGYYLQMIRISDSYDTDVLIDKILADARSDLRIRKYE